MKTTLIDNVLEKATEIKNFELRLQKIKDGKTTVEIRKFSEQHPSFSATKVKKLATDEVSKEITKCETELKKLVEFL